VGESASFDSPSGADDRATGVAGVLLLHDGRMAAVHRPCHLGAPLQASEKSGCAETKPLDPDPVRGPRPELHPCGPPQGPGPASAEGSVSFARHSVAFSAWPQSS
jgi:hypothetical protein